MLAVFQDAQEAFTHSRRGLLDDFDLSNLRRSLRTPVYRAGWKFARERFPREFVEFVDRLVAEISVVVVDTDKSVAEWKADMAAEAAKAGASLGDSTYLSDLAKEKSPAIPSP
jgi:hypothetical protein